MGSGILVVLAISQLCVQRRTSANNLLCLLSLVCFVWLAHGIGFRLGMLDVYPHLNKLHVPFLALTGPLWYVCVRALLSGEGWTRADRPHLLPAMVCVVLSLPFFLQSRQRRELQQVRQYPAHRAREAAVARKRGADDARSGACIRVQQRIGFLLAFHTNRIRTTRCVSSPRSHECGDKGTANVNDLTILTLASSSHPDPRISPTKALLKHPMLR